MQALQCERVGSSTSSNRSTIGEVEVSTPCETSSSFEVGGIDDDLAGRTLVLE